MHVHLTSYDWWLAGRYGGAALLAGIAWLARQRWIPHRHDGYVSAGGYVRKCSTCGKLPDGAYRAGAHGMIGPDGYDHDGYDRDGYNASGLDRAGHDRAYATRLQRAFRAGYNVSDQPITARLAKSMPEVFGPSD